MCNLDVIHLFLLNKGITKQRNISSRAVCLRENVLRTNLS